MMKLTDEEFMLLLEAVSDALDLWGISLQEDIMIEESTELIKSIIKMRRFKFQTQQLKATPELEKKQNILRDSILEESADVYLMLSQIVNSYNYTVNNKSVFKTFLLDKIARVEERIQNEKNRKNKQ